MEVSRSGQEKGVSAFRHSWQPQPNFKIKLYMPLGCKLWSLASCSRPPSEQMHSPSLQVHQPQPHSHSTVHAAPVHALALSRCHACQYLSQAGFRV